jgi:hypothetical protein
VKPSIEPDLQRLPQLISGMKGTGRSLGDGGGQLPRLPQSRLRRRIEAQPREQG